MPRVPKTEPKPLIDHPNASATNSSNLIRPRAVKVHTGQGASTGGGKLAPKNVNCSQIIL